VTLLGQNPKLSRAKTCGAPNASQAIVTIARPFQAMGMQQVAQQVADQQRANLEALVQMESRLRDMDSRVARKMQRKSGGRFSLLRPFRKFFGSRRSKVSS
jgi:hypothetical protein